MVIEYHEAEKLHGRLKEELPEDMGWVAFNANQISYSSSDFFSFKHKEEAEEFCGNNLSDRDAFVMLPIAAVFSLLDLRSLPQRTSDRNYLPAENGELNLSAATEYYNTFKSTTMNQKNFEYLRDQVKFTGFGEGLENELKEKISKHAPDFTIDHRARFGNDITDSSLHFKKSDKSDMYFLNSYNITLQKENTSDKIEQTFYINKGNNITLKEAFNLMNGRAVNKDLTNKEGNIYNAWLQMDFKQTENNGNHKMKQFHQNYGFDLNKELSKHPIKELNNEQDKSRLLESLQKGNRQSVTFIQNGQEQKHFIEANPQFKTVNVYDNNMQRVVNHQSRGEKQSEGENNNVKQEEKKGKKNLPGDDDSPDVAKASIKRSRKQSI